MAVYTGKMFESENPVYGCTYELIIDEDYILLVDDDNEEYYEVEADRWDDGVMVLTGNAQVKFYAAGEEE